MNHYKKYIRIPPGESVDIRPIAGIVAHPLFQRLLHVYQLSTTFFVFPGATHTRFEHAMGVYSKTRRFAARLAEEGVLTAHEAKNVALFALLHDIGHGPFSHLIERLTPYDHDKNGEKILDEMKEAVQESGGDFKLIKKCFDRSSPLCRIVMDKNLGMDKLDYLERDIYHTGFGQRPDVETIMNYLSYIKDDLVIDKKNLEAAKQIQRLYLYMYKEVYLHKSSLISSRFFQKTIALWLSLRHIDPEELWGMTDAELVAYLYTDTDPRLQFLYQCYRRRRFPSTGVVFRVEQKQFKERLAGKKIKVIGEKDKFFKRFQQHASPQELEDMEQQVAKLLKVPAHTILIVPTLAVWRFAPEDILYHDDGEVYSLRDTQPEYFENMKEDLQEYLSVRVCIIGNRALLHDNADKVHALLKRILSAGSRKKRPGKNLELEV